MPAEHEIRVRPVVRYIISHYTKDAPLRNDPPAQRSIALGEYPSAATANRIGEAVAFAAGGSGDRVSFEPVKPLRLERDSSGAWALREEAA